MPATPNPVFIIAPAQLGEERLGVLVDDALQRLAPVFGGLVFLQAGQVGVGQGLGDVVLDRSRGSGCAMADRVRAASSIWARPTSGAASAA